VGRPPGPAGRPPAVRLYARRTRALPADAGPRSAGLLRAAARPGQAYRPGPGPALGRTAGSGPAAVRAGGRALARQPEATRLVAGREISERLRGRATWLMPPATAPVAGPGRGSAQRHPGPGPGADDVPPGRPGGPGRPSARPGAAGHRRGRQGEHHRL